MYDAVPLGGFKFAGAYLLPPAVKPKKKKKLRPAETEPSPALEDKQAFFLEKAAEWQSSFDAACLRAGWQPWPSA